MTSPDPETRVIVGDVRVMDKSRRCVEAIALRDGRVLAVGTREEVEREAGPGASIATARGTVLPGFIDPHHHASLAALWGGLVRLVPPAVHDIASLQRALADSTRDLPEGAWAMATEWDELCLAERRAPTRAELDDAVPDRPLLAMHYSCHRAVANSRALELAGIDKDTPEPSGGSVVRGPGGVPTGLLIERGMSRLESLARANLVARDVEGFVTRYARHQKALLAAGITYIVDATVPTDLITLYRELLRRGLLHVGVTVMPVSIGGYLEEPWDALDGPVTGEEEGRLRIGPIKLVFDGAPGCSMCLGWWQLFGVTVSTCAIALRQRSLDAVRTALSVAPRLGADVRTGIAIYRHEEASRVVAAVLDRGFAVATHAIGNAAVDVALTAYEASAAKLHGAGAARIEHASFLDPELVARIAGTGAAVVTQPHLVTLPAYASAPSIPGMKNLPHRWLLDRGVPLSASSDYPVAGFDPLDGVRSAVSRRTSRGEQHEPDQCMTLDEALDAYTRVAAEVSGIGDRAGTLEPGKRADVVILNGTLTEASLAEARVSATLLGGEIAFGSLS